MNYQLTIIVPVFNESESLPKLHKAFIEYLEFTPVNSNILFINDGSTDESDKIIREICAEDSRFEYATLTRNCGLSTALKAGFEFPNTPYLGSLDADLQTSPMDFMLFFSHLNQCNMVNGIRAKRNDGLVKKVSSKIANGFRRFMINDGIVDTCCPLKIIETSYAQNMPFFKGMHRFIPALIQLQGGTVKQIKVSHYPRIAGTSKYHLFNRLVGPFLDTLAFVWMRTRWISYQIGETELNLKKR